MNVEFADDDLDRLETDRKFTAGFGAAVVQGYRRRMQAIRSAPDERTLYASRSMRFEKLKGSRRGQHSLRINDQWRLILELRGRGAEKIVRVIEIVDYH